MQAEQTLDGIFDASIYAYTRAQALEDGVLVDVTETANEAGFRVPVAMTTAAWADTVEWTEADSKRQTSQDESGRLWDVMWWDGTAQGLPAASRAAWWPWCASQVDDAAHPHRSWRQRRAGHHHHAAARRLTNPPARAWRPPRAGKANKENRQWLTTRTLPSHPTSTRQPDCLWLTTLGLM